MKTKDLTSKLVVITGAGSGIGRALALASAKRGANLSLCDVNEEGLAETKTAALTFGGRVFTHKVDVSSREQVADFAERTRAELGVVDLLINNAGVGLGAGFLDTTLDDWEWILRINLMGVVHGSHYFVPQMLRRGSGGHVANISSSAALAPTQTMTAYSTTKVAVLGLSQAMRAELKRERIGVTAICPGVINTDIPRSSKRRGWQATDRAHRDVIKGFQARNYPPERAAEGILEAVARNVAIAPIAPEAWALFYARRIVPDALEWLDETLTNEGRKRAGVT